VSPSTTDSAEPGTTAAAVVTAAAEPSLTITVENVVGHQGQLVVAVLLPTYGGVGPIGSACVLVETDPWTGSGTFSTFDPNNPCGKDDPYGEVISIAGTYDVNIGVLTPGERTPDLCLDTTAVLSGPSEVTVDAADMSTTCG
jgi:hypothetical protein